jgi:hypothetical protein
VAENALNAEVSEDDGAVKYLTPNSAAFASPTRFELDVTTIISLLKGSGRRKEKKAETPVQLFRVVRSGVKQYGSYVDSKYLSSSIYVTFLQVS